MSCQDGVSHWVMLFIKTMAWVMSSDCLEPIDGWQGLVGDERSDSELAPWEGANGPILVEAPIERCPDVSFSTWH